ncbi:MAG: phosphatidylserine/phosphatidylglycerophosphate/cardiolipin synthase family protein, partial [Deltaproteobacteria bacterium]|nr:phosphatidylserine/phosphatidylglycerophosphate/cardiolipin synthase family protein [Deltaproteobacteria bacterium]
MSRCRLLVGSAAFLGALREDIPRATDRVLVQAMTFEGDAAGLALAELLVASRATDRRVLVDEYTRFVQSDRFVYAPWSWRDPEVRREVRSTRDMFARIERSGGRVRYTNPVGPLFVGFPSRNHKKLVLLDDRVAYVGGINFSDHNFAWHDLMVRIDDAELTRALVADFEATWEGRRAPRAERVSGIELFLLDGRTNERMFARFLELVRRAERSIAVVSPYLTFPFCEELRAARRRGVSVTLLTPAANNKGTVRDYLVWEAARSGFELRLFDGMSHMKAMLLDERRLVLGSSNFDFLSYRTEDEILVVIEDEDLVADFRARVLDHDLAASRAFVGTPSPARGWWSYAQLKAVEGL